MTKYIKTIDTLYNKAMDNYHDSKDQKGTAKINGRMSFYGGQGALQEKYSIDVDAQTVSLWHWGTHTLEVDRFTGEVTYVYGRSNSDRDSINMVLSLVGSTKRTVFRPVNGGFQLLD